MIDSDTVNRPGPDRRIPRLWMRAAGVLTVTCVLFLLFGRTGLPDSVRVVDSQGRPMADVGVVIGNQLLGLDWGKTLRSSGPEGYVSLDGLVGELGIVMGAIRARARIAGLPPGWIELDKDTREITVPAIGSLEVRLRDEAGQALDDPSLEEFIVQLLWTASVPDGGDRYVDHEMARAVAGPNLRFERVVVGSELRLDWHFQGLRGTRTVSGPSRAGAHEVIEIPLPAKVHRITGRGVDPQGAAITGPVSFALRGPGTTMLAFTVHADDAGNFSFLLQPGAVTARNGPQTSIRLVHLATRQVATGTLGPPRDGGFPLGEVRFAPAQPEH